MKKEEIEKKLEIELLNRKKKSIGKNVISAALSLFTNPVESVEKLFFGIEENQDKEKVQIQQELILDLVCQINDSLENMKNNYAQKLGKEKSILIEGLIEVTASNSKEVTGIHITDDAPMVEFKSGTRIHVNTENTGITTGLKIGGNNGN